MPHRHAHDRTHNKASNVTFNANADNEARYTQRSTLTRYHPYLVGAYVITNILFILTIACTNFAMIPEIPHILFSLFTGTEVPWGRYAEGIWNPFPDRLTHFLIIGLFVLFQALALWGLGGVRLARSSKRPLRTASLFIVFPAVAVALALSGYFILVVVRQITSNNFNNSLYHPFDQLLVNHFWVILITAWCVWLIIGFIYWKLMHTESMIFYVIRSLLTTSWVEFSLALPIELSVRNRVNDCYCSPGSWIALMFIIPAMIFMFGPGLYFLYLVERKLSLQDASRVRQILRNKTKISQLSGEFKAETHVSNARTLSLIALPLGFLGLALGVFNDQRGTLFNESRDLLVARYFADKYGSDETIMNAMQNATVNGEARRSLVIPDSPFGRVEVTTVPQETTSKAVSILGIQLPGEIHGTLVAQVSKNFNTWKSKPFTIDHPNIGRLEQILSDLDIRETNETKLIQVIKGKLYNRHIKLPGIDFWDFNTESAAWMVALLCTGVLVALRNSLRQVIRVSDAGIAEPWLVLDAEAFDERFVARAWLVGIAASGWLSSFGLILSVVNRHLVDENVAVPVSAAFAYIVFVGLIVMNSWSATGIVGDLVRIRDARRLIREPADPINQID